MIPKAHVLFAILFLLGAYAIYDVAGHESGQYDAFNKDLGGCGQQPGCHNPNPSPATTVTIWTDATTFGTGRTYLFHLTIRNKNEKAAGCNIGLDPDAGDSIWSKDGHLKSSFLKFTTSVAQVTHRSPILF